MSRRASTGPPAREQGTVYTLHLDPPLGHARHKPAGRKTSAHASRSTRADRAPGSPRCSLSAAVAGAWLVLNLAPGTVRPSAKNAARARDCPVCKVERATQAEQDKEMEAGG